MAVDKTSFIHLTKFGSIEGMEVILNYYFFHFSLSLVVFFSYVIKANIKALGIQFFLIPDV